MRVAGIWRNGQGEGILMYLSESLDGAALACAFFRFGCGMRHSIWKATQLVHGTPRFAASQRTCRSRCEHPHHEGSTKHEAWVDLR